MKFAQNNHLTRLFGPTLLFGTWEYFAKNWMGNYAPEAEILRLDIS